MVAWIGRRAALRGGAATLGLTLLPRTWASGAEGGSIPPGRGRFFFGGWAGPALTVESFLPEWVRPDAPVVIVMHGVSRNAKGYCNAWADAVADGAVVVAPRFSVDAFPRGEDYQ